MLSVGAYGRTSETYMNPVERRAGVNVHHTVSAVKLRTETVLAAIRRLPLAGCRVVFLVVCAHGGVHVIPSSLEPDHLPKKYVNIRDPMEKRSILNDKYR